MNLNRSLPANQAIGMNLYALIRFSIVFSIKIALAGVFIV